jgi:hypothetical protein
MKKRREMALFERKWQKSDNTDPDIGGLNPLDPSSRRNYHAGHASFEEHGVKFGAV